MNGDAENKCPQCGRQHSWGECAAAERRRYALLQAAAVIDAAMAILAQGVVMLQQDGGMEAVERAESILALIERREADHA